MEPVKCTAWDCIGKYSELLLSGEYNIRLPGGRAEYEDAQRTGTDNVRLAYLSTRGGLHEVRRYVRHDTAVLLVPAIENPSIRPEDCESRHLEV